MMSDLTTLRNLGREMERKLVSVGIGSAGELRALGSKEAFSQLKMRYPNVCLVHLYVLEGAIRDVDYNRLPEDTKQDLKEFSDLLKQR